MNVLVRVVDVNTVVVVGSRLRLALKLVLGLGGHAGIVARGLTNPRAKAKGSGRDGNCEQVLMWLLKESCSMMVLMLFLKGEISFFPSAEIILSVLAVIARPSTPASTLSWRI
jgi:hypothetical protein